jgi:Mitochondrial carrier protein
LKVVSQAGQAASDQAYKGIIDCAVRVFREEGWITFYRGLPPRLVSVVLMIGIQFGVYEFMKRVMLQRSIAVEQNGSNNLKSRKVKPQFRQPKYEDSVLEEAMMEVAASQASPNPVPLFSKPSS